MLNRRRARARPIVTILARSPCSATQAAAVADAEQRAPDDPSAIGYLKEQQWTNEFATRQVSDGDVRSAIRVPANIEPVTGGDAIVAAPAAGRFLVGALPSIGDRVSAGAGARSP